MMGARAEWGRGPDLFGIVEPIVVNLVEQIRLPLLDKERDSQGPTSNCSAAANFAAPLRMNTVTQPDLLYPAA